MKKIVLFFLLFFTVLVTINSKPLGAKTFDKQDVLQICVSILIVTVCYEWEIDDCSISSGISVEGTVSPDKTSIIVKGFPREAEGRHLRIKSDTPVNNRSQYKYKTGAYAIKDGSVTIPLIR